MSDQPFRWGIIGPGGIARRFVDGLQQIPDARLEAVGSRDAGRAEAFAKEFGAARSYGSYQELVADPNVDAIYVATPHTGHKEGSLLAIEAGKPVLCEKPFTVNAAEAEEVIGAARRKGVFLMEGMWTRFSPLMARLRSLVKERAVGPIRMLQADFGFRSGINPTSRLYDPNLAGGALLDVGIYPVSLASMLFGTPEAVAGLATIGGTGVDEQSGMLLRHAHGELAVLHTAIRTSTYGEAILFGEEGSIKVHGPWHAPRKITVMPSGKEPQVYEDNYPGSGFQYEALEVAARVRAGEKESLILPLDETLSIMKTMDALRAEFGLRYPME